MGTTKTKDGYRLLAVVIFFLISAQLSVKLGASTFARPGSYEIWAIIRSCITNLFNPYMIISLGCTFLSGVLWILVIQKIPMSRAYPVLSLNFLIVYVISCFFFDEQMTVLSFVGTLCVAFGTLLLRVPGRAVTFGTARRGVIDESIKKKTNRKEMEL